MFVKTCTALFAVLIVSNAMVPELPISQFSIAKEKWDGSPKKRYLFEYQLYLCGLCNPCKTKPMIIHVDDKVITDVSFKYENDHNFCMNANWLLDKSHYKTINELFEIIWQSKYESQVKTIVAYDTMFGYPKSVTMKSLNDNTIAYNITCVTIFNEHNSKQCMFLIFNSLYITQLHEINILYI